MHSLRIERFRRNIDTDKLVSRLCICKAAFLYHREDWLGEQSEPSVSRDIKTRILNMIEIS